MNCWQCGQAIKLLTAQKINTRDTCGACDADLHACRGCRHFDPISRNECREVMAEPVTRKDRNNYCDYFSPADSAAAARSPDSDAVSARSSFDQLFKKS